MLIDLLQAQDDARQAEEDATKLIAAFRQRERWRRWLAQWSPPQSNALYRALRWNEPWCAVSYYKVISIPPLPGNDRPHGAVVVSWS